jgi:NAD(P)-dependent dehydrogenase (short-subunit alcohol dehydrogenase family)
MYDFKDKVIVVTGAAGNLGGAVVKAFLENFGTVCAIDHRVGRLEGFKNLEQNRGVFWGFDAVDVSDKNQVLQLSERISQDIGAVDILVNTVGGFSAGERVHELSAETWQRMIDLNVKSFLSVTAPFVPNMIEKGAGKVVSIGAKSALKGGAKSGAYAAAKSALLRLTESMADELKPDNIQVNMVLPGIIDTPDNRKDMPNADFSRWVSPEQVADVILFLCSSASDVVSGAAIPVYGNL